jgi:dephospho-CoA kinase
VVALDVPLLFETNGVRRVDATVVVTAPPFVQRARVLARPGMTTDKLDSILKRQLPDPVKRRRADFVVRTGLGKGHALRQLTRIVARLSRQHGRHWPVRRDPLPHRRRLPDHA